MTIFRAFLMEFGSYGKDGLSVFHQLDLKGESCFSPCFTCRPQNQYFLLYLRSLTLFDMGGGGA